MQCMSATRCHSAWKGDMAILVTGAAGLIGRAVVIELGEAGIEVKALYHSRVPEVGVPAFHADLTDSNARAVLASADFDGIVHCAALFPRPGMRLLPDEIAERNLAIDHLVLDVAVERKCPVVYLSSVGVYGSSALPWRESSVPKPDIPYARAKLQSEADFLERASRCACLRVSSPYGPGQTTFNVLRLFIDRAMAGQDLLYHGSGSRTQDFIAAKDVAIAARSAITNQHASGVFNIAGGSAIAMRDLAQMVVGSVAGSASRVLASGEIDPQEHHRADIDIGKASRELVWSPRISLEEGIRAWVLQLGAGTC